MLKTISASDLRTNIKDVLNQIAYGHVDYLVEKFGEPTVAMISIADYGILQEVRQQQTTSALREMIEQVRARRLQMDEAELSTLIDEARTDFHRSQNRPADAH